MRYLLILSFLSCILTTSSFAANEPVAGAIIKDNSTTTSPNSKFAPDDMTNILPSLTKESTQEADILFSADSMSVDEVNKEISANGSVVVTKGQIILKSDTIIYNQDKDIITAEGNVSIIQDDGSTLYTDKIILSEKMQNAFVENVKVIMQDKSQIWAKSFEQKSNKNKRMKEASYTVCDMCENKSPLWQIDARKVNYDALNQNINYNDAILKIKDVPVLYLPFLSHPSPEVKRRSGFLMASMGSSSYTGEYIQPTYFWNISDQTDLLFSPYFTTERGVVLDAQYRQYFYNGHIEMNGTYLKDDSKDYEGVSYSNYSRPTHRGNFSFDGRYEFNDYWVGTADLNYVSDIFYLKDMNLNGEDDAWLVSKIALERFEDRDYAAIEGYYYKLNSYTLKTTNDTEYESREDSKPTVLPYMEYENITDPNKYGAYIKTSLSSASVYRENDEEAQRLSMINSWELPYTSNYGEQYKFVASLKSDFYYINNYIYNDDTNDIYDGTVTRFFPQLGVEWRLPFVRATESTRQIIEPIIVAVVAPEQNNYADEVPNSDSVNIEFDDMNILSLDRYAGYDRNDDGSRVSYGLNWSSYGNVMGRTSAFIAQSFQITDDSDFMEAANEEGQFSDVVGRVYASPNQYLDLNYRYRLDKNNFELKYSELGAQIGSDILKLYTSYIYLEPNANSYYDTTTRKELYFRVDSKLTQNWSVGVYNRFDLTSGGGSIEHGGNLSYEDECLKLSFTASRYFYDDLTLDDGYEFGINFYLKTLGGMGSN